MYRPTKRRMFLAFLFRGFEMTKEQDFTRTPANLTEATTSFTMCFIFEFQPNYRFQSSGLFFRLFLTIIRIMLKKMVWAWYSVKNLLFFCNHFEIFYGPNQPSILGYSISPSGISELDCATTKTDTAERSISIGRETLQVFFCTRSLGVLPGSTARG